MYQGNHHTPEVCSQNETIIKNLSKYDIKLLEKALEKRKADNNNVNDTVSSGDGPSTSKQAKHQWSHAEMDACTSYVGLNDNEAIRLAEFIRDKEESIRAVEAHYKQHLVDKKRELEPYFSVEDVTYDIEKDNGRVVPTVHCSDILGLVRYEFI